jgi:hypothetical protein
MIETFNPLTPELNPSARRVYRSFGVKGLDREQNKQSYGPIILLINK